MDVLCNQGNLANIFGEGNGTPLQYSCLKTPMDGGAWWAAVHGVAKSRTDWVTSLSLFNFMHWRRKWEPTPLMSPTLAGALFTTAAAAAAKSFQSCPTLCDPIDGSPPGSPIPGILQARTLEWAAISFNAWKWKVKVKSLSRVWLFATPWTAAYQAPPSMGVSRQEYWSGLPLPSLAKILGLIINLWCIIVYSK